MATGITLGEIMQKAVVTAKPNDTIEKVAEIMGKTNIGGVIITKNNDIKGIVTEGDIIKDIVAKGKNQKETRVKKIMRSPVKTAEKETDVEEALKTLRDLNIERLPIIEEGELVGIVSERDLTRVEPALIEMAREKEALTAIKNIKEGEMRVTGKCEDCENTSNELREINGKLICPNCRD